MRDINEDPFSFLNVKGKGKARSKGKEEDEDDEDEEDEEKVDESAHPGPQRSPIPPAPLDIDHGICLPCECDTPAARTVCLQQLVPKGGDGDGARAFHKLVKLVNTLEVSSVSLYDPVISYIILGHRHPKWVSEYQVAIHQMVMGWCPSF